MMGNIFCIVGKSSSGKDTVYKKLLENSSLRLKRIVPYTTRPIRAGEQEGVEYHFATMERLTQLQEENKIIECRSYDTVYGVWYYFMVQDSQIDLDANDYLIIGTLESFIKIRDHFGRNRVLPVYIDLDDGERLSRALEREKQQSQPRYEEMCRRFIADAKDFSEDNLARAGITVRFDNHDLKNCLDKVEAYITANQEASASFDLGGRLEKSGINCEAFDA